MKKLKEREINDPNIIITKPFGIIDYYKLLMNSLLVNFTIDNQSKILTNEMSLNNFTIQSIISNYLHNQRHSRS